MTSPILKPGDRVELTARGVVISCHHAHGPIDEYSRIRLDGGSAPSTFFETELAQMTIRVLSPEIRVGDQVRSSTYDQGKVIAIHDGQAWGRRQNGTNAIWRLDTLTLIPTGEA